MSVTSPAHRITRRRALALGAGVSAAYLMRSDLVTAQGLDKVSYQTNWRAQAEHGGFYQAVAAGIYKKYGIECRPPHGRPADQQPLAAAARRPRRHDHVELPSRPSELRAGRTCPSSASASIFQKDPQVIICHPGVGNDSFAAAEGQDNPGRRRRPHLVLALSQGHVSASPTSRCAPTPSIIAPFLADKNIWRSRASCPPSPSPSSSRPASKPLVHADRRCRLRQLQHHLGNISRKMVERDAPTWCSASSPPRSRAGLEYHARADLPVAEAANALIMQRQSGHGPDDKIAYAVKVMNEERHRHLG